jgi:hypothetical protein
MGASKLQYLAQTEAIAEKLDKNSNGKPKIRDQMSDDLYKESLVYAPQDILFLRVVIIWSSFLVLVGWFGIFQGMEAQAVGFLVNVNMIFFYAAPLTTMKIVVDTRCSDSIHGPTITLNCVNAAFWFLYGAARRDIVVWGPNSLGLCLGVVQVLLCLWYPKSGKSRGGQAEFQSISTWDADPESADENIPEQDHAVPATL